jgi:tetratricopeptide (TPR) repeat protein
MSTSAAPAVPTRAAQLARPAALAALALTLACGAGRAQQAHERKTAASLEPARLRPDPVGGAPLGTARVRVYADADYRSQNPGHKLEIRRLFGKVSRVLEPSIGLRLEVVDVRDWQRQGGSDLGAALTDLEYLDPANDVDWVVGMVNALGQVSMELHQMGYAHVLGHHMVVRGLNDAAEVSLLNEVLGTISMRQRQELYARRKRHKEQVIVLHELAHTLGAMHVTDPGKILYPTYEHTQSSFGPQNAGLMRVAAEARMARGRRDEQAEWRAVLSYIEKTSWSGWNEDEKALLVAEAHRRVRALDEGTGATLGQSVRPADRERFRAAERLEAAGKAADAWEDLEPLIDFYPDEPEVQRFACRLAVAAQRDRSAIESRCARAVEVAPGDAEPHLRLSQAYFGAKDTARALASARKALELLGKAAADGRVDRLYGDLAAHLQALGAVTWAEQAAAKSKRGGEVAVWARTTRARYGIGPRGAVPPEREGEYVAGVRDLLTKIYGSKFADAEKQAASLARTFRGAAGIEAARCDLEIRRRRYPVARSHCATALRRHADASWAHYLTGVLDKHDKRNKAAVEHLERAISLDPDLEHAYQLAAEIYGELGRPGEKKRIAEAYKAKFGRDLQ